MTELTSEDKLLVSRAEDTLRLAENRFRVKTLGFLNPHQRMVVQRHLLPSADMKIEFDGGYTQAERSLLVCYPEFCVPERSEYICVLECTGRDIGGLSHRDYLGSLMGLGIVRENIGDILVSSEKTSIFIKPEIADYVMQNLTKIGRCGIRISRASVEDAVLLQRPVKEISATVSALRLDAVLAAATGLARGRASELIRSGLVAVNWEIRTEVSDLLKEKDVISVRGYGRMELSQVGGLTRKGRCSITVIRYL